MSRQLFFRTLVFFALLSSNAIAQIAPAPAERPALTLRAAIDEARARNPELIALQREYEVARAAQEAERYLMPPMTEVQIWGWPVTTLNPARTDMYMFMGEQQLPGRGKRAARVLVAERTADMARQQIAVRANQIVSDIRQAFIDVALTRETFGVYARQAKLLEELAETATSRYAAGEGPQHHTVTTVVELAALERQRIQAEERAQTAEVRLNALLGRPVSEPVEHLELVAAALTAADAEQQALARHPEVAMLDAALAKEEAELARLRSERRPDYVVGGGYMLQPGNAGAWTARAGITWPNAPWSRGRLNAEIDVQSKRVDATRARGDVIATQLRQAVRQTTVRLAAAQRHLRLIESTVLPQIQHAFELSRLAYAAGEGDFTEVLEARRMLLTTQLDAVEARGNLARARADLETVAGAL
jgi:cobalt-zinc-cadmium efflux system outer membrane protein